MSDFEDRVRAWTGYAERWSRRQERRRPGEDWWAPAGRALWKAAVTYRPDRGVSFASWLHANLRNEMANDLKRWRRRRARLGRRVPWWEAVVAPTTAGDGADVKARLPAVLAALDGLPARQSDAIRRHYLGGESRQAIARARGVSRPTVQSDIDQGLARLRADLTLR